VVFKAAGPGSTVPAGCSPLSDTSGNASGVCNGYSATDFAAPVADKDKYDCQGINQRSNGYCPRNRSVLFAPPGPDYIGIYLRYEHQMITGLFTDQMMIEQTIITRAEPSEVGS